MEKRADYTLDRDATGFVSTNRAPMVEIRLDDLAFLIGAGLSAAWDPVAWPGEPETESERSLDAMGEKAEQFVYGIAITKRRIKAARLILRSLFPGDEKYKDEHWYGLSVLDEPAIARCPCASKD